VKELTRRTLEIMREHADVLNYTPPVEDKNFYSIWARHYAEIRTLADIHVPRGSTVLEVGLGYGVLARLLVDRSDAVISLEHPSRTDFLSAPFRTFVLESGISLIYGNILNALPLKARTFDAVFLCDVIEHVDSLSAIPTMERLADLLRPGGVMVLSTPNLRRLGRIWKFLCGQAVNPFVDVRKVGDTYDHIREYVPSEMEQIGARVGLTALETRFWPVPYFDPEWGSWTKRIGRLFPSVLEEFGMVLKKGQD